MKPHIASFLAGLCLAAPLHTSNTHAAILTNGGFESPPIPTNSSTQLVPDDWRTNLITGWIFNGDVRDNPGGDPGPWPLPQEGQQYVDIANYPDACLAQTFAISVPGLHRLTWYDNTANVYDSIGPAPYSVTITDASHQTVISRSFTAFHPPAWQQRTVEVNLAAGSYDLTFTPQGEPETLDVLLDNVSLELLPLLVSIHVSCVDICWNSRTNHNYQVQYQSVLTTNQWVNLGAPVPGDGGTQCLTDSVNGVEKRFYRVQDLTTTP